MTDYILSLDKIRNKFIDKDGEELSVPQSFGLASPTVEKQTKEADVKVDSPATEALGTAYQYDTGDYNTTEKYDYQIQPGDTLTKIAREAKMTIPELIKMNKGNPAIKTSDLIYAGGTINLSNKVKTKSDIINYDTKPASVLTEESNVSKIMYEMSEKYDLPFNLVMAVGQKESGLNPYTVAGDAGTALGLMQVRGLALKDVNKHYGLDITRDEQNPKSKNYDIRKSIESGVAYLALQKDKYGADTDREVLAQYNGGPTGNKKKAALEYADSVLGLMKNVKPFDFDAKFTTGSRTPPGEVDSYAIEADNNFREVENASVAGVDYDLLSHANNTIKGVKNNIMPNLDLVGTVKATATDMLVDSISLSDKLSNQLKGFAKQIGNATDIEALKEKAEEVKNFLAKHQKDLANFTGTVKDKTMEALGSGGSAESGGIGFSGQGEFRPDLSGAAKTILNKIKGAGESVKEFFDTDKLVDVDGKGTMVTTQDIVNAYKSGDVFLQNLIGKNKVEEKPVDKKLGDVIDVDKVVLAGFPLSVGNLLNNFESSGKKDEVSNAFFNEIKGKVVQGVADASRKTAYTLLPSNFANLFSDVVLKNMIGLPVQTSYVTEKDFSSSEFNTVKNAAITALNKGKMNIDYEDYGKNSSGVKASQLVGKDNTGIYAGVKGGAKFMKDLFTDPKTIMTYTLGGASMRIDKNNNVIVTDQYDAEKFKFGSGNPGLYGKARNFLQNFLTLEDPSIKGENPNAIRFEINLGKKDELLKTKGLMEKS